MCPLDGGPWNQDLEFVPIVTPGYPKIEKKMFSIYTLQTFPVNGTENKWDPFY